MMREKIIQIIDTLCQVTNSGELEWEEVSNDMSKRSYQRSMYSVGEDGTKFEIDIKYLITNEKWNIEQSPNMWIKSKDLPGGGHYVYGYKEVIQLRDIIKEKYCSDMSPKIEDVEGQLDNICKGISLSTHRDNKITEVLK